MRSPPELHQGIVRIVRAIPELVTLIRSMSAAARSVRSGSMTQAFHFTSVVQIQYSNLPIFKLKLLNLHTLHSIAYIILCLASAFALSCRQATRFAVYLQLAKAYAVAH